MLNRAIDHVYELVIHQNHPYPQLFPNPDKSEILTLYVRGKDQAKYFRDHLFRGCKMTMKGYLAIQEGDHATLLDWNKSVERAEIMDWMQYYGGDRAGSMPVTTQYCLQFGGDLTNNSRGGMEYRIMPRLLKKLLAVPNASLVYYEIKKMQSFESCTMFHIDLCANPDKYTSLIYKDSQGTYSFTTPIKHVRLVPEVECKPDSTSLVTMRH